MVTINVVPPMARQQMRMNTCRLFLEANAYSLSALIVNKGLHLYSFLPAILNDSTMSVRAKTECESSEIELSRDGNVRDSDSDRSFLVGASTSATRVPRY